MVEIVVLGLIVGAQLVAIAFEVTSFGRGTRGRR